MECYHELMAVFHFYKILSKQSPLLGFTATSRESDRMYLLALKQISLMCLEMAGKKYHSLQNTGESPNFNKLNRYTLDDGFQNYLNSANEIQIETLEEKLIGCLRIINELLMDL